MSTNDLVEIYRAQNSVQAQLYASALEDEGIKAVVDGYLSNAVGIPPWTTAARILVPPEDALRARQLVEQFEKESSAETDETDEEESTAP